MSLKTDLKKNKQLFGTWCIIPSPEIVNVLCKSGLDFVLIDFEHGPVDFVTAQKMIMAAHAEGKEAVVRVGKLEEVEILRSLDIAPDGIMVPHIETKEDMEKVVSFVKYPPEGQRGYSPYTRAGGYCVQKDYTKTENDRLLVSIIIESKKGVDNLDDILKNPSLDMIYLGAYDISLSLGHQGEINHPDVIRVIEKCVEKAKRAGKASGALYQTKENLEYFSKIGVNFLVYKVDTMIINEGLKEVREVREQKNNERI